jgi:rhomboid protease GluP
LIEDPDRSTSQPARYPDFEPARPPLAPLEPQRALVSVPQVKPFVTYTLLGLNVLIFLLQFASQSIYGVDLVAAMGMKANESIVAGQLWRLFTPMFLHGSILHLAFNMYALFIFGPGLERHYGHGRFVTLFLLAGFAGNVVSFMFSQAPSLGSSTAIFGLLGAEGVFLYHNQRLLGGSARRALNNIIVIALINFVIGLQPGIDNWGHLGGLLGGTLFAWLGGPLLAVEGVYPNLRLADTREPRQVWLAGFLDLLVFGGLAFATILLRSGVF